jgi:hypothetical protein
LGETIEIRPIFMGETYPFITRVKSFIAQAEAFRKKEIITESVH